jgi:hypothetical protein
MELTELKNEIIDSYKGSKNELNKIIKLVEEDHSIFPFNEYEHLICTLIAKRGITYRQYIDIRTEYINANPNLWLFEISSPRGFGEKFAQTYIEGKCSKLKRPSKKLDKNYKGNYDLWLDDDNGGIRIEVKASRAVDSESDDPLYMKALSRNTTKKFDMNFQQLKPQDCDVFVWLAVFRDQIVIWVMSSKDVLENPYYSKGQHRGNKGNEGQLHINQDNIKEFSQYELRDDNLEKAIRDATKRSKKRNLATKQK